MEYSNNDDGVLLGGDEGAASPYQRRQPAVASCYSSSDDEEDKQGSLTSNRNHRASRRIVRRLTIFGMLFGQGAYCYHTSRDEAILLQRQQQGAVLRGGYSTATSRLQNRPKECTVWIAPSSLPGHPGYGIFTTRDLEEGENVLGGPDGVSIPVLNPYYSTAKDGKQARADWTRVWDNYWWGRGVPDHVNYADDPPHIMDYQIGFGALPNHHCLLSYLHSQYPTPAYDDGLVSRGDPGMGAFTYSRGREFVVTHAATAGDELFLNYGYCDHDNRHNPDWSKEIYMTNDFTTARDMIWLHAKHGYTNKLHYGMGNVNTRESNKNKTDSSPKKLENGTAHISPLTSKLEKELIPKTQTELDELMKDVWTPAQLLRKIAKGALTPKTPDWIREHGMCMENIVPRRSILEHAGQGAFAQFDLHQGEIIAPAPLLQILDKHALVTHDGEGRSTGHQLLLNYCFGHPESTLLLCPNSNAVLINHCSTRQRCGNNKRGPNAMYQWSSGWDPSSDAWRNMTLDEMLQQNGRGLAFEIRATRDIAAGEEIFIDYGPAWEKAWKQHMSQWKPDLSHLQLDNSSAVFVTAKEANERGGPILPELVAGSFKKTVEHSYLFTGCQYWETNQDWHEIYNQSLVNWRYDLDEGTVLRRYSDDGSQYRYRTEAGYTNHYDRSHWPCSVLMQEDTDAYIVRIHQSPWHDDLPWADNGLPRILTNYPRKSIHYFVQPLVTDQHLKGVFRQEIGIRPDLPFPEQWKNVKPQH